MVRSACLIGTAILAVLGVATWRMTAARGAEPGAAPAVFWHEGEVGAVFTEHFGPTTLHKIPASGGACLQGGVMPKKGSTVRFDLVLPQTITDAQIIIRYARAHWRTTMTPVHLGVEVADGGESFKGEGTFYHTGGWGYKPKDWQVAAVKLGTLKAGPCTVTLTGLGDDNDISTDGFFLAPGNFQVTAAELDLNGVAITSEGYVGLQSPTTVRQNTEPVVRVAARSFSGEPKVSVAFGQTEQSAVPLKATSITASQNGINLITFALPKSDDGHYVLVITGERPACRVVAPLVLAGQLFSSFDARLAPLASFTSSLTKSTKADEVRCAADFVHLVDYLKARGKTMFSPAPRVDDLRQSLCQGEETMRRLQAGQDPYAGRSGDLRRAYRSAISGELRVYRVLVPDNYAKTDKVPLILVLHGSGGDENTMPDLDGDKLEEILNQRGYLAAFPSYGWHVPHYLEDLAQLVEVLRKEYPKVDPARIYCTGCSMGGFTSCRLAAAYPDLFAGIAPDSGTDSGAAAGPADPALAEKLKNVPTIILQGGADLVVPKAGAEKFAARLKELGGTVELHIFPDNGHNYNVDQYLNLSLDFFEKHPRK